MTNTTVPYLGEPINTVQHPPYDCPKCARREPYAVHQHGVRWACGHTQQIPPMPAHNRGGSRSHTGPAKRRPPRDSPEYNEWIKGCTNA